MSKILFLVPYPHDRAPSQRFRFEQYLTILKNQGHSFRILPFFSEAQYDCMYSNRVLMVKIFTLLIAIITRYKVLAIAKKVDFIFIHRETCPIGPPVLEWVLAKLFKKRLIYDFDDAIWLTDNTDESWIAGLLKWRSKVSAICKWSYKISCGNNYLCEFARKFNSMVVLNPTTIDTNYHQKDIQKAHDNKVTTIGWTGSTTTLKYLKDIEFVLNKLEVLQPLKFLIISDKKPDFALKIEFFKWSKKSEIEDLSLIDIGIMPLPDDKWANGKCGFKALQYMALEIPCVVSPVGVNSSIVENGIEGYLASSDSDWVNALNLLIDNRALRKKLGANGRKKVLQFYSVESNSSNFLSLFE